jgi:hypothetical protein
MSPSLGARLRAAVRCLAGDVQHARRRLKDRREADTIKFECSGLKWFGQVGYFDDGSMGEVFLVAGKTGELVRFMANDMAISASMALQWGCPPAVLRDALSRDSGGLPLSPLAGLLDTMLGAPSKEVAARQRVCPHGYVDWDACPDCCH